MNKVIKVSSLLVVLALLSVMVVRDQDPVQAAVEVAAGDVEWAAGNGDDITSVRPGTTATFFINDDGLNRSQIGVGTWERLTAASAIGDIFNLSDGTVKFGGGEAVRQADYSLEASDYASSSPASTPLVKDSLSVTVGDTSPTVSGVSERKGTFSILIAVAETATMRAEFRYHVMDTYADLAKVTSTSDPQGEVVSITQVDGIGATATSSDSIIFRGDIPLSGAASAQGTNDDGVWVQDGDTLTISYLDDSGDPLDTDTVTVDAVDANIANVTLEKADGSTVAAHESVDNTNNPVVSFEVTDTGAGIDETDITLTINAEPVPATELKFRDIDDGLRVTFDQTTSWKATTATGGFGVDDSTAFALEITAEDGAGNASTLTAMVTIDETAPGFTGASTGDGATAVTATFSEDLDSGSVSGADFRVTTQDAVVVAIASAELKDDPHENTVDIVLLSGLPSNSKPEVKVVGEILDNAGNAVVVDTAVTASDGIPPGTTIAVDKDLAVTDDVVAITVVTDEKLQAGGLTVYVFGPATSPSNGGLSTTSAIPQAHDGSLTVDKDDVTGQFGISIQASDGPNKSNNLTAVADEAQTVTAGVVTLSNGPIGDANFDGRMDVLDVTVKIGGVIQTLSPTSTVDASARTITLGGLIADDVAVTVDYRYVAADFVFEVDQDAPTVAFVPDGTKDIQGASPFIRVTFTDDAYPGDTFKAVTLDKAEHTPPGAAATATDIATSFVARSSSEYMWSAQNLALGEHKLVVAGTDTAGNATGDKELVFTISLRDVDIILEPGWNLISIPDQPTPSDVDTVFGAPEISTVLTYDPTVAGLWSFAVRDAAEGTLIGGLDTVEAEKGYWVESAAAITITVKIPGITAGAQTLPPAFRLPAGWNLVSVNTPNLDDASRDPDEYFSGLDWSRAYSYDSVTKTWDSIVPDGDPNDDVTDDLGVDDAIEGDVPVSAGKGYFIYLNKSGTLVP